MKNILPVHDPLLKFSPCYAAAFSIIDICDENLAWLINNYGGLFICEEPTAPESLQLSGDICAVDMIYHGHIMYHEYSGLKTHSLDRVFCHMFFSDFMSFVKKMIDNQKYIFTFINEKYISAYDQKIDFPHPIFIYGYDNELELAYASDFFGEVYKRMSIPFVELTQSFDKLKPEYFIHEDYLHGITLYEKGSYYNECYNYSTVKKAVLEKMKWLIHPYGVQQALVTESKKLTWGLNVNEVIANHLLKEIPIFPNGENRKPLSLLNEHKLVLQQGIHALYIQNDITEFQWNQFINIARKYSELVVKYLLIYRRRISSDAAKEQINSIADILMKLQILEAKLYKEIITQNN